MRQYIDPKECCQDGLSLLWDKWKASEARDHRALVQLRRLEDEHLAVCSKCNPELLVDLFFIRLGKVRLV